MSIGLSNTASKRVIQVPITPYSDDVASYINSLGEDEILSLFTKEVGADVLTAALYALHRLRSNVRKGPRDRFLFQENINDLVTKDIPTVFLLLEDGDHQAHIYAWGVDIGNFRVTNIIGLNIRQDNLTNELQERQIITPLLSAIHDWALNQNHTNHYLRMIQPLGFMIAYLSKSGFIRAKELVNEEEMKWLFENTSLGNTPLTQGLLFREHDYISRVTNPLMLG